MSRKSIYSFTTAYLDKGTHDKAKPQSLTLNKKDIKEQMQLPVINTPLWLKFMGKFKHAQVWRSEHENTQALAILTICRKKNPTKQEWSTTSVLVRKGNWNIPRLGCWGKISLVLAIHLSPTQHCLSQEQYLCWGSKDGLRWMLGCA